MKVTVRRLTEAVGAAAKVGAAFVVTASGSVRVTLPSATAWTAT